jgi:oligopeptidase B
MPQASVTPPAARAIPYAFVRHGLTVHDDYRWLQDKTDPDVIAYLEAENAYARAMLDHTRPLQEQIYKEMRGRIKEDDASVPERRGDCFYYWRMEEGKQYRLFCCRRGSPDAAEQILLDENALAEGHSYCRVNVYEPSPDQNLLAYSVDTTGSLVFDLYVKDLRSGALVAGPVANTAWSAAWASDSRTLFYTTFDDSHRAYRLLRHTIGDDIGNDALLYEETDERFDLEIERTRSGAYLLLTVASGTSSEARYLPADEPLGQFRLIEPRRDWVEYYVEHHGDCFLIRCNDQAENFRLLAAPVGAPQRANWREIIPHRADTLLEAVDAFRDHLVLHERSGGLKQLRISAPDGVSDVRYVAFPDAVYTFSATDNPEFENHAVRFVYSSPVTPESTVDCDMTTGAWDVKKRQEIPSGYDATRYAAERVFATAADGAQVPISLVYRKELVRDGARPLLLEGYGSYGYSREARFDTRRFSLLDRGFVYAIAHVRGGSEMGRAWYEHGRLMHKKNTFTDFIACAEHLIAQGYTSADRLAIMGGSAGGLLVTAVMNMRPDLCKAVVALVPFTNVITAMLTPDLPLTVTEYEQWGHPDDPQAFAYMLSYSPYENVQPTAYPAILAKTGLNDLQVPYWDPAKWTARLRTLKTDSNPLLLIINMGAGHGGASGRYDHLREDAQVYAFLVDQVGV